MLDMPILETARLRIRPFVMEDLADMHRLFDIERQDADLGTGSAYSEADRSHWLQWTVLNYVQLARLYQPPYGDRAVILRATGRLVGSCGFVPCLNAFEQLPAFGAVDSSVAQTHNTTEFGLFYAISPAHQGRGYASEAAHALVQYAFQQLRLKRVVATTSYDNLASVGVMRKLGMRIERNPQPDPPWLQIVGILENSS